MRLRKTRSVCPVCLQPVKAELIRREGGVYMEKSCPAHGAFSVPVWRDKADYEKWRGSLPEPAEGEGPDCPRECGDCGGHMQGVCCVLLEVTGRCNLRCNYCFAQAANAQETNVQATNEQATNEQATAQAGGSAGGVASISASVASVSAGADAGPDPDAESVCGGMPPLEELKRAVEMIMGAEDKPLLQFSGGEPTLRDDLPELIAYSNSLGCRYTQLNSNGIRLAEDEAYVQALARAGLSFVFMQFDGTDDGVYTALRGKAIYQKKLEAVRMCDKYGIGVVLVPTVVRGINDSQIGGIVRLGASLSPAVRGVHFQPVSYFGRYPGQPGGEDRYTLDELLSAVEEQAGIDRSRLLPSRCDHPLCGFHGSFLVHEGSLIPLSAAGGPEGPEDAAGGAESTAGGAGGGRMTAARQNREYVGRRWKREPGAADAGGGAGVECREAESEAERGKAKADTDCGCDDGASTDCCCAENGDCDCDGGGETDCCCGEPETFDGFLDGVRKHGFTLSAMAFQDAMNLDVARLRRCSLHVYRDGKLKPFCAAYLTAMEN